LGSDVTNYCQTICHWYSS